jgi:hypothetical protein
MEVDKYVEDFSRKPVKKRPVTKSSRMWEDSIVIYKTIARQRLGKHIPAGANARNNRTFSLQGRRISQARNKCEGKWQVKPTLEVEARCSSET